MESHLRTATFLANFLDNQFNIAGIRFGFSALIDLIPGIGDIIDVSLAMYLVWIAVQLEVPALQLFEMLWNVLLNFLIGLIPVLGDAAYLFRRANLKNLGIIQRHVQSRGQIVEGVMVK